MLANRYGIFPLTGRAHCQRQVAYFGLLGHRYWMHETILNTNEN